MSNSEQTPAPSNRVWIAPHLERIGTIADVAANANVLVVQNPNRS